MRIALLSDIHGNLVALETVLQELAQEPIDQIVCLRDVAALGPQPHEVRSHCSLAVDRSKRLSTGAPTDPLSSPGTAQPLSLPSLASFLSRVSGAAVGADNWYASFALIVCEALNADTSEHSRMISAWK